MPKLWHKKSFNSRFLLLSDAVAYASFLFIFYPILDAISGNILSLSRSVETLLACFALINALINVSGNGN